MMSEPSRLFSGSSRFLVGDFSKFWQHAREDLQPEIFFIAETIGSPLDGTNLVVDALYETQRHLVLLVAIGFDAVPVGFNHPGEFLEGLQTLPAERFAPLVEETSCPPRVVVIPQLAKRFLEQVGFVQPLVGPEQELECRSAIGREVPPA